MIGLFTWTIKMTYNTYKWTGGRLNKKDGLTRYGDSHVLTAVLSLTWKSPYVDKTVFILRRGPGSYLVWMMTHSLFVIKPLAKWLLSYHRTMPPLVWGGLTHGRPCVSRLDHYWSSQWLVACSVSSHYLKRNYRQMNFESRYRKLLITVPYLNALIYR